jgi:hypothetical protein
LGSTVAVAVAKQIEDGALHDNVRGLRGCFDGLHGAARELLREQIAQIVNHIRLLEGEELSLGLKVA